jgi:hypothetical protein
VIEAAILATRIDILEPAHILNELDRLAAPVAKTGGHSERSAFDFLRQYVRDQIAQREQAETASR